MDYLNGWLVPAYPVLLVMVLGAYKYTRDKTNHLEELLTKRLERMEDKIDRLVERIIQK